ncbi:MAG: RHS repeat-associated core domain-containing protein [Actinomycetota bacterium]|nr:RHS repeat-associated core domain-containing protein [Actinomycetota bacterium]
MSANEVSLNGSTPSGPSFAYDQQNRMTEGPSLSSASYDAYSYDPASNLTSVASVTAGASTNPTVAFAYDPAGELCYSYEAGLPSGTSAPACGQAPPTGATDYTTYAYNADGERTMTKAPSGTTSYSWNALGELTGITTPGSSQPTTYAYDGAGLRMSASTGTSTTQFTWDQSSATPRILMDGENAYLYGPSFPGARGAPLEQISLGAPSSTSSASYLFSDPSGVRATISATGEVTSGMSYDAYGNPCGGCHLDTPFGFAGGYEDPTGLVYLVNRYYDPATAQFLSVDPLVGITGQPYAYAGDDPVNASDPSGLITCPSWVPGCGVVTDVQNTVSGVVKRNTIGLCLNGEVGAGPAAFASLCLGFAGGHFFLMETAGGGGGAPNAGVSLGLLFSNATNPHQLAGPFAAAGSSADPFDQGPSVGSDGAYGTGPCNAGVWEAQPEIGLSLDNPLLPFETHGGVTNTWVQVP